MALLSLHYEKELQGRFSLKKRNLLFVFQVNCPGCFTYGIPLVNQLFHQYEHDIGILGLSTAFEDFEYNNLNNTRLLLEQQKVVGATKKVLQARGSDNRPESINFPVAMDKMANDQFDYDQASEHDCRSTLGYRTMNENERKVFHNRVIKYLKGLEYISLTFTLNQMRGTPTLIFFDNAYRVLLHHFGHIDYSTLKSYMKVL